MIGDNRIPAAWSNSASELAAKTLRLVVIDRYGGYNFRPLTQHKHGLAPRKTGDLTERALPRHFVGA